MVCSGSGSSQQQGTGSPGSLEGSLTPARDSLLLFGTLFGLDGLVHFLENLSLTSSLTCLFLLCGVFLLLLGSKWVCRIPVPYRLTKSAELRFSILLRSGSFLCMSFGYRNCLATTKLSVARSCVDIMLI